jgi:hypothetical protein
MHACWLAGTGPIAASIMVRVGASAQDATLREPHVQQIEMAGRTMTGFVRIIDGRKQPQGGPVEVRPTAGHHRDKAVMDEGRGGHRYGRAFGLG